MMGIVNNTGKKTTQNLKIANKCMRHDMTATLKPLSLNMGYRISSKFVETQVQIQCATATYLPVGRIGMYGLLDTYVQVYGRKFHHHANCFEGQQNEQ